MSNARKRIDTYIKGHQRTFGPDNEIDSLGDGLDREDLESVLADADRDREFAEAVRVASERLTPEERLRGMSWSHLRETILDIFAARERIYEAPCTKEHG